MALASEGKWGAVPPDYSLFAAAKYLGVAPWDLAEQPSYWRDRALTFADAEDHARRDIQRRSAQERRGR